ncbi:DUF481 domain-containing protein [Photobacterium sp. DNB23_23_1]|uniref:DUF481 domain-containing protein n=1 Tax=Photobacterium pectinilyticum TaxID=2906793 RepID=A0ABT1N619_9GAMM|nr:DUF481 domain-containing protein [Photobacterium sp. ZSDE20]MCQ1060166.1 DUF481 domain-containing protein [Photobacterium sp. ZSDE20]MDD1827432.1 DUF481 domain-containing protein [Photobacterium sp. ZSDE20]
MARTLLALLLLASTHANAATSDERPTRIPPPLTTELELGYQSLGGNSDSQTLNTRIGGTYLKNQYRHSGELRFLLAEKDGEEDKRKGQIELQSDKKVNERTYVLGNVNYVDDRYGPYFNDFTLATGMGYQLIRRETLQVEVEAGPGYRHQEPNLDELDDDDIVVRDTVDELILRGSAKMTWKPSKTVEIGVRLTGIAGNSNSTMEAEFNLTTDISDFAAIKISNNQKLNSWVPEGLKKRDSAMTVNLLFKM